MSFSLRSLCAVSAVCVLSTSAIAAQSDSAPQSQVIWQPVAPLKQVLLWPKGLKIARPPVTGPERMEGKNIENVIDPTMTIYPPKIKANGTAVLVFPGGGFNVLAMGGEGTDVCSWLTSKGVTCVLVKYRVPKSGPQWDGSCNCRREPAVHMATQDAQRAIALVRHQARALSVDPHRVGVIGFSAGGFVVADVSNAEVAIYTPVDDADKESVRPDFAIAAYPGHLWEGKGLVLNPTIHVTAKTPPTFLVQAGDDAVDDVRQSLTYYLALKQANVPVEMHLYAHGNHGFALGLRHPDLPVAQWPALAAKWMQSIGVL
jgi:acetyl esterase/lipase